MNVTLKGNIYYCKSPQELCIIEDGYLVCEDGTVTGVFAHDDDLPGSTRDFPLTDYSGRIIIPGLCDLHTHAPQYPYRGLGLSLELLEWLDTYTYPEESRYSNLEYASRAYGGFVNALSSGATTRACVFATSHLPATVRLMEMLESSGIVTFTGLVNMDRNCPKALRAENPQQAFDTTEKWLEQTADRFSNTRPILTPRFIPTCSDELMRLLKKLQTKYDIPVQSHLSENLNEIEWVRNLAPEAETYAGAYDRFGLFGGGVPTVMAHCVWCNDEEKELLRENGVYVAHCPQSNTNIASGIAPIRDLLARSIHIGLGTDVAGGSHLSMFRAISDAIQASKLYWRLVDDKCPPLTFNEAFYLATAGGGSFFGKVGSFESGFEFDAVVLDESKIPTVRELTAAECLERLIYLGGDECVTDKYVRGVKVI